MKPHFKLNHRLIMGWLFILSIPAIPVSWLFFQPNVLLWAIVFFAGMTAYQVGEVFYDEHKTRQRITREINATAHLDGTTILDAVRTQRIYISKHLFAFYSIHTRAITFRSKEERRLAEKAYSRGQWAPPSFNWFVDANLFEHLDQNLKA